jgi:hypothetical protein
VIGRSSATSDCHDRSAGVTQHRVSRALGQHNSLRSRRRPFLPPSCAADVDAIKLPERLDLCRSLLVSCLYRDAAASPHEFFSFFLSSFIRKRFSSDQQTSGTSHSVHAAVSLLKCSRTTTMTNAQPVWFDELDWEGGCLLPICRRIDAR